MDDPSNQDSVDADFLVPDSAKEEILSQKKPDSVLARVSVVIGMLLERYVCLTVTSGYHWC